MHEHPDVKPLLNDDDDDDDSEDIIDRFDEHSLGRIFYDSFNNKVITPMLTYHEYEFSSSVQCNGEADSGSYYTSIPTSCTKDAMGYMASDSDCNSQSSNIC